MPQGSLTITPDQWAQLPQKPQDQGPQLPSAQVSGALPQLLSILGDVGQGAGQGLMESGIQGGKALRMIPGVNQLSSMFPEASVNVTAQNPAQKTGAILEHLAEIIYGGKGIGGLIETPLVNMGLQGAAGNPLLMHAKTIAQSVGTGLAAGGSDVVHHGGNNAVMDAALGAAGPIAGEGFSAIAQSKHGQQILPYLAALASGGTEHAILGGEGLGAGLAGFGLTRILAKDLLNNPYIQQLLKGAVTTAPELGAAANSHLNQ